MAMTIDHISPFDTIICSCYVNEEIYIMSKFIDPNLFNLPSSTKLRQIGANQFDIVIQRKSRIIMKDGEGILIKAKKIKEHVPNAKVRLRTSAPVCGKTRSFLKDHNIGVQAC